MSESSLSGRGQGHVSNFYIVDLETFVTASRRFAGNIPPDAGPNPTQPTHTHTHTRLTALCLGLPR